MTHYLCFDFKWKTFNTEFLEIFPGLTMRHALSHTPGLCLMQVNLRESGTWIFTSDQYHVKENYEQDHPQGMFKHDCVGKLADTMKAGKLEIMMIGYIQIK